MKGLEKISLLEENEDEYEYYEILCKPFDKLTKFELVRYLHFCKISYYQSMKYAKNNKKEYLKSLAKKYMDKDLDKKIKRKYNLKKIID